MEDQSNMSMGGGERGLKSNNSILYQFLKMHYNYIFLEDMEISFVLS